MIESIIRFSLQQRLLVFLGVVALIIFGAYSYERLNIDAVPDITNVQVQINTEAPGYTPLEAEQRITFPVENAMIGIPHLDYTRSLSRYGLSQVTVAFEEGTDIYLARQLIGERIQEIKSKLPHGLEPAMGPIATGLGEIYMYSVEKSKNATTDTLQNDSIELRTVEDWIIKPQLRNTQGVIEVNAVGGSKKQYQIAPSPAKMLAFSITVDDIVRAIQANNANVGAGYVEQHGEQYLVRSTGQVKSVDEIKNVVVGIHEHVPIHISDVADVFIGQELRTGAATLNGDEVVLGTVFMLMGENSRTVAAKIDDKMKQINQTLPKGIEAKTLYNRMTLVDATIDTVKKNLFEGAILVVIVLFLLLGNITGALITALIIPLSMLFTISGMVHQRISGNLMSLGAIDFGIIVDGAVIIVENCIRRLSHAQAELNRLLTPKERFDTVLSASKEVISPSVFGVFIIMAVYLPILTLTGIEGKMFRPMAYTVLLTLTGALILSVTFIPAAIYTFLTGKISETESWIIRVSKKGYKPILNYSLTNKSIIAAIASVIIAICIVIATQMGAEFIPSLDEGDIAMHAIRIPGTSLTQSISMQHHLEKKLKEVPEIKEVFSKIGTAEIATDPMPPSVADTFIMLKPKNEWPNPSKTKTEFVEELETLVKTIPGNNYEFTQPIQMRFNELISGIRSDIAVKVYGDDMDQLLKLAEKIANELEKIPGASDVKAEQITGLPLLTIHLKNDLMSRYGLSGNDLQEIIEIMVGGKMVSTIFEGDRRFDIVLRLPEGLRADLESIKNIPVPLPKEEGKHYIPLSEVAEIEIGEGPNQISRENGKRLAVATANIRGRDIGSFVDEAQEKIQKSVHIPAGYWISWGGQFEQLISAVQRLLIVVPIVLGIIFVLLFITLGSIKDALIVFTGVPLAMTGGILALWLRGIPFSISAGIGFIALSGVAVLNGVVMISFIKELREKGESVNDAVFEGSMIRLRPVLMTALVASLGFIPMALATSAGAEVQRPLATVVIGGILSSTALTLIVLPVLYHYLHRKEELPQ